MSEAGDRLRSRAWNHQQLVDPFHARLEDMAAALREGARLASGGLEGIAPGDYGDGLIAGYQGAAYQLLALASELEGKE